MELMPLARERGVDFGVDVPEQGLEAKGNRNLLSHALLNLARDGLEHGRAKGTVTLMANSTESGYEIQVIDDGNGMESDILARAGERFVKGQHSRGSGLGMAIARSVIEAHGGQLQIRPVEPGPGLRVCARVATMKLLFKSLCSVLMVVCAAALAGPEGGRCIAPAKAGGGFDLTCQLARDTSAQPHNSRPPLAAVYQPGGIGALAFKNTVTQQPPDGKTGRRLLIRLFAELGTKPLRPLQHPQRSLVGGRWAWTMAWWRCRASRPIKTCRSCRKPCVTNPAASSSAQAAPSAARTG